jgi:hypothetical protein
MSNRSVIIPRRDFTPEQMFGQSIPLLTPHNGAASLPEQKLGRDVAGIAKPAYHDEFRYPAVKVYDPYGDLQRAGKPGPFYQ